MTVFPVHLGSDLFSFICSNTFHILRPTKAPGFVYAWLELISHRIFIARMLAHTPQQKVCKDKKILFRSHIQAHMLLLYACLQLLNFGLIDWLCLEGLAHVRAAADWSLQVPGPVPEECRAQQTYANSLQGMLSFFLNKTSETHVSVTFVWLNTLKLGLTTLSWNVVFSLVVIVLATSISTLWCCLYSYGIYLFCLHNEFHHSQSVFLVKCWITQPSTNC